VNQQILPDAGSGREEGGEEEQNGNQDGDPGPTSPGGRRSVGRSMSGGETHVQAALREEKDRQVTLMHNAERCNSFTPAPGESVLEPLSRA